MKCKNCFKDVPNRKYCDQCGKILERTREEWLELLENDTGGKSFDIIWENSPEYIRDKLFEKLFSTKTYERIKFILSLLTDKMSPLDFFWKAKILLIDGKNREAMELFLYVYNQKEIKKHNKRKLELEELILNLFTTEEFDDVFPSLPNDLRYKISSELLEKKQYQRLEKLIESIKPENRSKYEYFLYPKILTLNGKKREAMELFLEQKKYKEIEYEVNESILNLFRTGEFDDIFPSLPSDLRYKISSELLEKKQYQRLEKLIESIEHESRTENDWKVLFYYLWINHKNLNSIFFSVSREILNKVIFPEISKLIRYEKDVNYLFSIYDYLPQALRQKILERAMELQEFDKVIDKLSKIKDKSNQEWSILLESSSKTGSFPEYASFAPKILLQNFIPDLFRYKLYKQILNIFEESEFELLKSIEDHKIWIQACKGAGLYTKIPEAIKGERFPKDENILELYYKTGLELEKSEETKNAAIFIYEAFVNQGKVYKDVNSRYLRLVAVSGAFQYLSQPIQPASVNSDPNATVVNIPVGGKYIKQREIGRGGMAIVYEAINTQLNKRVAIKEMRPELAIDRKHKEQFILEAKRVAELHHTNIVDIYDIIEDRGIFIVFEYIEGKTLLQYIQEKQRLNLSEAIRISIQICNALSYAHSKKIIHRDIKPSNIMLTNDGVVKIMDFGIAREANDALTRLTVFMTAGTFAYMAPEQHSGQYDERSDIYSFGITLYEMLTGELPFKGPDFYQQKRELYMKKPRELREDIPIELENLIMKCLNPDKEKRYKNTGEILNELSKMRG